MKTMNLSEIIAQNEKADESILYELIHPYLKILYVYYKDLFCCEPVLMVTDVTNASQYCRIVDSNDFSEAVCDYLGLDSEPEDTESDDFADYETIMFNSKLLKDLITK
jgi:hypothetical protein